MNSFRQFFRLLGAGAGTGGYYASMNYALRELNNDFTMLHYPLYRKAGESFYQSQVNLTDLCLGQIKHLKGKKILEVGCGNGIQSIYVYNRYEPAEITGIDLNEANIRIANNIKESGQYTNVRFLVDDAHTLEQIPDNSMDCVLNIESAFHYPDKQAFLNHLFRILKPGGCFVIADILTTSKPGSSLRRWWKHKMILHHWSPSEYIRGFQASNLVVEKKIDITEKVIRGFRNYKQWLRAMQNKPLFRQWALRAFYVINIKLNIYLLLTRRKYLVFAGVKASVPYR